MGLLRGSRLVFLLWILVMELHQKASVEDVLKKQSKKSDHLVLGPAAGQGLPNRLQCQGFYFLFFFYILLIRNCHFECQGFWTCTYIESEIWFSHFTHIIIRESSCIILIRIIKLYLPFVLLIVRNCVHRHIYMSPHTGLWSSFPHLFWVFSLLVPLSYLYPSIFTSVGTRALNKTHFSVLSEASNIGDNLSLVTVFTVYNSSFSVHADNSLNLVTVGNASYNKEERSMAILNAFINFIQVHFI